MNQYLRFKTSTLILSLLLLTGCQLSSVSQPQPTLPSPSLTSTVPVSPPAIKLFDIQQKEILIGETAILTWDVENATTIEIIPDIGEVSDTGSISVTPDTRTTYQIVARNTGGSVNRSTVINVNRNAKAKPIALTIEEMEAIGFRFITNSEPSQSETVSSYYVKFVVGLMGPTFVDNTVYIYRTTSKAETIYAKEKNNIRMYVTNFINIGTQGYYMIIQSAQPPEQPTISVRFQKNNVYVKMTANVDFSQIETYARVVEERIE